MCVMCSTSVPTLFQYFFYDHIPTFLYIFHEMFFINKQCTHQCATDNWDQEQSTVFAKSPQVEFEELCLVDQLLLKQGECNLLSLYIQTMNSPMYGDSALMCCINSHSCWCDKSLAGSLTKPYSTLQRYMVILETPRSSLQLKFMERRYSRCSFLTLKRRTTSP